MFCNVFCLVRYQWILIICPWRPLWWTVKTLLAKTNKVVPRIKMLEGHWSKKCGFKFEYILSYMLDHIINVIFSLTSIWSAVP